MVISSILLTCYKECISGSDLHQLDLKHLTLIKLRHFNEAKALDVEKQTWLSCEGLQKFHESRLVPFFVMVNTSIYRNIELPSFLFS
jgi:hypothetical protein